MEPGEDTLFNCEYFSRINSLAISSEILYSYYIQGNQEKTLSHKYYKDLYEKTVEFMNARDVLYEGIGLTSQESQTELARQNVYYAFKCIPNMYRFGKEQARSQRVSTYKAMIENEKLKKWVTNDISKDKLVVMFRILYKIGSPAIMDSVYRSIFTVRNHLAKK